MIRAVTSTSAAIRLHAVRAFLAARPAASESVIVGASRGAADDVARTIALQSGATFGLTRCSLIELAARAVFEAVRAGELAYFAPVAAMPGFPKAVARTVHELRLAGIDHERLSGAP